MSFTAKTNLGSIYNYMEAFYTFIKDRINFIKVIENKEPNIWSGMIATCLETIKNKKKENIFVRLFNTAGFMLCVLYVIHNILLFTMGWPWVVRVLSIAVILFGMHKSTRYDVCYLISASESDADMYMHAVGLIGSTFLACILSFLIYNGVVSPVLLYMSMYIMPVWFSAPSVYATLLWYSTPFFMQTFIVNIPQALCMLAIIAYKLCEYVDVVRPDGAQEKPHENTALHIISMLAITASIVFSLKVSYLKAYSVLSPMVMIVFIVLLMMQQGIMYYDVVLYGERLHDNNCINNTRIFMHTMVFFSQCFIAFNSISKSVQPTYKNVVPRVAAASSIEYSAYRKNYAQVSRNVEVNEQNKGEDNKMPSRSAGHLQNKLVY